LQEKNTFQTIQVAALPFPNTTIVNKAAHLKRKQKKLNRKRARGKNNQKKFD